MTPQQQLGSSVPIQISGVEYQIRTLTEKDHVELSSFIQQMIIEIAKQSASGPDRAEILKAGISTAFGMEWDSEEGWKIWDKPAGMARLTWQSCNKPEPYEIFLAKFMDKNYIAQNVSNFLTTFYPLNFTQSQEELPDGSSKS